MDQKYQPTVYACFVGYIVQAIVNNFVPLLFLTFHSSYGIPLIQITFLVTLNFGIQLLVDLASVAFVDRIGYRLSLMIAHGCAAAGLALLALGGDVGCSGGPTYVGAVSSALGGDLKRGILLAIVFPVLMLAGLLLKKRQRQATSAR